MIQITSLHTEKSKTWVLLQEAALFAALANTQAQCFDFGTKQWSQVYEPQLSFKHFPNCLIFQGVLCKSVWAVSLDRLLKRKKRQNSKKKADCSFTEADVIKMEVSYDCF